MRDATNYAGWTIVSVDETGGVLLDGPGGDRRRVWFGEHKAESRVAALVAVVERLRDDDLATEVALCCNDPRHDDRWCPTCGARADAIEAYRAAVLDEDRDAEKGADDARN